MSPASGSSAGIMRRQISARCSSSGKGKRSSNDKRRDSAGSIDDSRFDVKIATP